ncbi:MAG TPA: hypothetical protein VNL14_18350 [Candidatus Acidoferrales bacterium]|nr:hypothetical protein [Candidatus Acidoferrales bacterium]
MFGEFAGQPAREKLADIPKPEARDLLLKLITVQGDTEFASVEQRRRLIDRAPADKDLRSLVRINAEEMRHGWQMSYLLVEHFGDAGGQKRSNSWSAPRIAASAFSARSIRPCKAGSMFSPLRRSPTGTECTSSKCRAIRALRRSRAARGRC